MTSVAKKTQSPLEGTTDRLKPYVRKHAPIKVKVKQTLHVLISFNKQVLTNMAKIQHQSFSARTTHANNRIHEEPFKQKSSTSNSHSVSETFLI